MSNKLTAAISAAVIFFAVFAMPSTATAASRPVQQWRPGTTVCVQLGGYTRWNIRTEVSRWNALPGGPRLVVRPRCGSTNSVDIRIRRLNADWTGWTDWTSRTHAVITLNSAAALSFTRAGCVRAYTAGHELGHIVGLPHRETGAVGNLMSYDGWNLRCGRPGPLDIAQYNSVY